MRAGKLDKVLHHLGVAHGVYADGFLQRDAHYELCDGYFQFCTVERARHFGDGDDLVGYVMRRKVDANASAYAGFEDVVKLETGLEHDEQGHVVGSSRTLDTYCLLYTSDAADE